MKISSPIDLEEEMLKQLEIGENALQRQQLENKMLKEIDYNCIRELYAKGTSKRAIARLLSIDVKTVRRYLKRKSWEAYRRTSSSAEGLLRSEQDWLMKRMPEVDYNASILFRELKELLSNVVYENF